MNYDEGESVFLDENDIIGEIPIDEEELPDADDIDGSDAEISDGPDDAVHIFQGHADEVFTVACSPTDRNLVATGGKDDIGFLWNICQGDWAFKLKGHSNSVSTLGFSFDGQLLASGSFDGLVKVWDISYQNVTCKTLDCRGQPIKWVKWHPRGHLVLTGSEDSSVFLWNADSEVLLNMFFAHNTTVTCGDFTPDGKTICIGYKDATLRIWNPKVGGIIHVVEGYTYHTEGLTCLSLSSDSTLALTGSSDSSVHLVNLRTGKVVGSLTNHSDSVECVGFASSSFPWAASGGMDEKLVVWDLQYQSARCTYKHAVKINLSPFV
ncbi:OLC1v1016607C1 [Oldenlandia corymbosa var. corymbosa]|uniref:OLC1v1016607C1 n=1 Tax=Oldenlandia corymbosa var. corymbosa TaxID=529605 RepID=A0AAV1E5N7_OLDCO|nr:OLC1v1016607C1 [Oldenlandia corymbosa var. corymbosa]